MPDEPEITELNGDENEPASKGDLYAMERRFSTLLKDAQQQFTKLVQGIEKRFTERADRLENHFDVVAENIHKDVAGANQDKIDLLDQKQQDHEERIADLEKVAS